jgi:hypothetical protein
LKTALAMAAGIPVIPISPTPRAERVGLNDKMDVDVRDVL